MCRTIPACFSFLYSRFLGDGWTGCRWSIDGLSSFNWETLRWPTYWCTLSFLRRELHNSYLEPREPYSHDYLGALYILLICGILFEVTMKRLNIRQICYFYKVRLLGAGDYFDFC